MADDDMGDKTTELKGMTLAIEVADYSETKQLINAWRRWIRHDALNGYVLDFFAKHTDRQTRSAMDGKYFSLRKAHIDTLKPV